MGRRPHEIDLLLSLIVWRRNNPQGIQDGAKARSFREINLSSSQATLSHRVGTYFLKTLQIVASGMVLIA